MATAHTSDTETLTGSPLRHSIIPTDDNQNPIIKSTDIIKGNGSGGHYSQGTYPFTGKLIAQDTAVSWNKSPNETYNDDIQDGGVSRSYFEFESHRSSTVTPLNDMLQYDVNTLDDFGNVSDTTQFRGVSFFRPKYVKNPNVAVDVLDGTHQWTRTTDVNKSGNGPKVSPMSNSESQVDLELIGGFTYIHNAGNTTGQGAMQLGGQPVKVNIITNPPQRNVYSVYG